MCGVSQRDELPLGIVLIGIGIGCGIGGSCLQIPVVVVVVRCGLAEQHPPQSVLTCEVG